MCPVLRYLVYSSIFKGKVSPDMVYLNSSMSEQKLLLASKIFRGSSEILLTHIKVLFDENQVGQKWYQSLTLSLLFRR